MKKEDADRVVLLYEQLQGLEDDLGAFRSSNAFHIFTEYGASRLPVESSIARKIGYKYLNEEIDKIKKTAKWNGVRDVNKEKPKKEPTWAETKKMYNKVHGQWPKKK